MKPQCDWMTNGWRSIATTPIADTAQHISEIVMRAIDALYRQQAVEKCPDDKHDDR